MYIKILKTILGIILVIAGIIAFFLPVIPGIILLVGGLFILGVQIDDIKKWLRRIKF